MKQPEAARGQTFAAKFREGRGSQSRKTGTMVRWSVISQVVEFSYGVDRVGPEGAKAPNQVLEYLWDVYFEAHVRRR